MALAATFSANAGAEGATAPPRAQTLAQFGTDASTQELGGTDWLLRSLGDTDTDPQIGSSLSFDEEGSALGNGGCNRFKGAATVEGTSLKFGDLASTMMACEELVSAQESSFHAALAETVAFGFEHGELLLFNSEGETVARLSPAK